MNRRTLYDIRICTFQGQLLERGTTIFFLARCLQADPPHNYSRCRPCPFINHHVCIARQLAHMQCFFHFQLCTSSHANRQLQLPSSNPSYSPNLPYCCIRSTLDNILMWGNSICTIVDNEFRRAATNFPGSLQRWASTKCTVASYIITTFSPSSFQKHHQWE